MVFKIISSPVIRQYLVIFILNLNVLSAGYGMAWPSPMMVKLRNSEETVLSEPITLEQGSWVISSGYLIGALVNFTPPFILDVLGRKKSIMAGILPKVAGSFFLLFASKVWMLILGMIIMGISDMFIFTVVPTYASEISSKEIRGSLGTFVQLTCSMGIVVMLSIGPFISYIAANIVLICIILFALSLVPFLPESPYYLYLKGRKDESMTILTSLRGCEIAAKEEIKQYDLMNTTKKINKLELYKQKLFWKSLGLTVTTNVGTQFLGYFAIGLYLQTILESTHSSMSPELSSVIIGAVQIVASIFTATTTDKFGRKPILTVSILGMMVGMICLGVFFYKTEGAYVILGFMNYLPLIAIAIIIFCYSAGPGSINSVLCAELFDNNARTLGVTLNMSLAGIAIFVLMKLFPFIVNSIGPAITYWIFAFNCLLLCTFIAIFIPETKGKSFVDIQRKLGAKIDSGEEKTEIS